MGLLDGKKALVTGVANKASIAWGIARALHAQGAELAFSCHEKNVRRVRKLASEAHSEIVVPCDVRNEHEIADVFERVEKAFQGKLDILVHSIAYADLDDLGGEFINISRSGWTQALEISAYSLVAFSRSARPLMNTTGGGSIITLTYAGGQKVAPGYNIMGIAKAALDMSVRYLAYDLGPENIRVNAISAGPIPTLSSQMVEDFGTALKRTERQSPLLRNVTLSDIGGAAVYLASDLSNAMTGAVLKVDCGMSIVAVPTSDHHRLRATHGKKSPTQ